MSAFYSLYIKRFIKPAAIALAVIMALCMIPGCSSPADTAGAATAMTSALSGTGAAAPLYPSNLPSGTLDAFNTSNGDNLSGTWYYLPDPSDDATARREYIMKFDATDSTLEFIFAYLNSESVNDYKGYYQLQDDGTVTALLSETASRADNMNLTMSAQYLASNTYATGADSIIVLTITSCDNDSYSGMVGVPIAYESSPNFN